MTEHLAEIRASLLAARDAPEAELMPLLAQLFQNTNRPLEDVVTFAPLLNRILLEGALHAHLQIRTMIEGAVRGTEAIVVAAEQAAHARQLEAFRYLVGHLTDLDLGNSSAIRQRIRDAADATNQLEYYLAAIPLIAPGDPRAGVRYHSSLLAIEYFHLAGMISSKHWIDLMEWAVYRGTSARVTELWQIRSRSSQGIPSESDHRVLSKTVLDYFRSSSELGTVQVLLALDPAWTFAHRFEILDRIIVVYQEQHDRYPESRLNPCLQWFVSEYQIDLGSNELRAISFPCGSIYSQFVVDHLADHPVYYRGALVRYYLRDQIRIVLCREQLPMEGWFSFQIDGVWIYSLEIYLKLSPKPGFQSTQGFLPLANDDPLVEVYSNYLFPPNVPIMITPPKILVAIWREIGSARKSARSASAIE